MSSILEAITIISVLMQANVLLVLDLILPKCQQFTFDLFGNNVTEIANNEILPMCPNVYRDYRKHPTRYFAFKWLEVVKQDTSYQCVPLSIMTIGSMQHGYF